jgi:hypothetical protein
LYLEKTRAIEVPIRSCAIRKYVESTHCVAFKDIGLED